MREEKVQFQSYVATSPLSTCTAIRHRLPASQTAFRLIIITIIVISITIIIIITIVRVRSFGPLHHGSHVWLLVQIYPDLGPLSCWLQKRSLAQFKLVAELVAGEFTPDIRTLTVIA